MFILQERPNICHTTTYIIVKSLNCFLVKRETRSAQAAGRKGNNGPSVGDPSAGDGLETRGIAAMYILRKRENTTDPLPWQIVIVPESLFTAARGAVNDRIPAGRPLFAPGEGALADRADLGWQMELFVGHTWMHTSLCADRNPLARLA